LSSMAVVHETCRYHYIALVCAGSKYCPMLMKESGVEILKDMLTTCQQSLYDDIVQYVTGLRGLYNDLPQLAESTINRCERFAVDSDYLTDDEQNDQE